MGFIVFDKESHTYTDAATGQILPFVNQIINAVYGSGVEFVSPEILKAAAERGTDIHAEGEQAIKGFITVYKHPETAALMEWVKKSSLDISQARTEVIVSVEGKFAGTADLICGGLFDYKTSRNKPTKSMLGHWQKQLSMYYYAEKKSGREPEKMTVLHLTGNTCTPYDLEYLGDAWVEETLTAYYEGRKIEEKREIATDLQTIDQNTLARFSVVLETIANLEKEIEPIREQIKAEMEKRGILNLKLGNVSISYVAPTKRKTFDAKRFKADNAEMYEQYTKESEVKSSIRIQVD